MSFGKTLLAGAAVCALCTAPALARVAPDIHLAGVHSPLTMKVGSPAHFKSGAGISTVKHATQTITFSGTLSADASHEVPIVLWGETWYQPSTCAKPTIERGEFPRSTAVAKITEGTTTGTISGCGTAIFTFYGPVYEVEHGALGTDSFSGTVKAIRFIGYDLTLNANTKLTITPD